MRCIEDIYMDLEHLSVLCRVLACSLDECEFSQFTTEDFSACLHHLCNALESLLDEMIEEVEGRILQ